MTRCNLTVAIALLVGLSATVVHSQLTNPTVYRMQSSSDYHTATCSLAKSFKVSPMPIAEAVAAGMGPCLICRPHETPQVRGYLAISTEEQRARPFAPLARTVALQLAAEAAKDLDSPDPEVAAALGSDKALLFRGLFMLAAKKHAPEYTGDPLQVHATEDIAAIAAGPAVAFSITASERVRKMEPLTGLEWPAGVTVTVSPLTINAPSFEKVVLTRDGEVIEPVQSSLKLAQHKTRMGASFSVHDGAVVFPVQGFLPTARVVTLTLIPTVGRNVVRILSNRELRSLQVNALRYRRNDIDV
jgi:hypothetical protein